MIFFLNYLLDNKTVPIASRRRGGDTLVHHLTCWRCRSSTSALVLLIQRLE